jgi:Protein of unknown function with HXXEE motif
VTIPIRHVLWLLGVSFALHEAEEWNLVTWEHVHFTPPPQFDDLAARTLLVLFAFLGLSFTALSVRFLSQRGALIVLLPLFVTVVLGNALTHIFWLFYFRSYAPGVVSAGLLLVPLTFYLLRRVVQECLVPRAYVWALLGLAALQPLGAAVAGASLSESQLALQRFGMRFSQWLWGAA